MFTIGNNVRMNMITMTTQHYYTCRCNQIQKSEYDDKSMIFYSRNDHHHSHEIKSDNTYLPERFHLSNDITHRTVLDLMRCFHHHYLFHWWKRINCRLTNSAKLFFSLSRSLLFCLHINAMFIQYYSSLPSHITLSFDILSNRNNHILLQVSF